MFFLNLGYFEVFFLKQMHKTIFSVGLK